MDNDESSSSTNAGVNPENVEEMRKENVPASQSTNLMEKSFLDYEQLVVPPTKISKVWRYFGYPAKIDGYPLSRSVTICTECKMPLQCNGNVHILKHHLRTMHPQEWHNIKTSVSPLGKGKGKGKEPVREGKKNGSVREEKENENMREGKETEPMGEEEKKCKRNVKRKLVCEGCDEVPITIDDDDDDENYNVILSEKTCKNKIDKAPCPSTSGKQASQRIEASDEIPAMTITTRQSYKKNKIDNSPSCSCIDEESVTDAVLEFIMTDLQVPDVEPLQSFIASLGLPCEIPSKSKLENAAIPQAYESLKVSISFDLSRIVDIFCLAIEEWRSNSGESYVTFAIYYQNPEKVTLQCKVLNTVHAPRDWTEVQCGGAIDSTLRSWNLRVEKITVAVVGTSRSEFLKALRARDIGIVPCLLHTLQLCVRACFENPVIADILDKCRTNISAIYRDDNASSTLARQEKILMLHENSMIIDYPPVWTSTYNMLEQMVVRQDILVPIVESIEDVDGKTFQLTENRWKIMSDLVDILRPLKFAIETLSEEEKIPLISIMKPLLWELTTSHFRIKKDDSEISRSLKESLSDMLRKRYADESVMLLLQITTDLDPRYKELSCGTIEHKTAAAAAIKKMMIDQIVNNELSPCKRNSKSGMESLLGGLCASKNTKDDTEHEITKYKSEAAASFSYCPLRWWTNMSSEYPNIYRIALRYNCVPACCLPTWKISPKAQVLYHTRRAALPSYLIDKLLFLHGNRAALAHDSSCQ